MRRLARSWKIVLGTLLGAIIFAVAASTAVQYRKQAQVDMRADLTFTGAVSGRMTELKTVKNRRSSCSVDTVQGVDQWAASFVGSVDGKPMALFFALTPYHGAGIYTNPGVPDAATLKTISVADLFKMKISVHMGLNRDPLKNTPIPDYATEPGSPVQGPLTDLIPMAGLGKATVTLEADKKTGRVDAILMNSATPTGPPVHVRGTFRCA